MSFDQAIRSAFKNYANFNGRARRSEYWYIALFNSLMGVLLPTPLAPVGAVLSLVMLVPTLAAACRRLHDTGRSGLYLLIGAAPLVGWIILLIWLCEPSQPGWNQYGAGPGDDRGFRPAPAQGDWTVRCVAGPLRGQTYPLRGRILIGRGADCFIRLPEGTPGASSIHCALRPRSDGAELTDLGSTYGTFLSNGRQLPPNFPETLYAGDSFYLGSRSVMFQLMPPSSHF